MSKTLYEKILYELVFDGLLVDGVSYAQAKKNVLTLFKASPEQVSKMFRGGKVVLRNKLDKIAGDKYVAVLYKNGLMCRLEAMADDPDSVEATPVKVAETAPFLTSQSTEPNKPEKTSKIDEILRHTRLKLDPLGVRMSKPKRVESPVFLHMSEFEVAPPGTKMSEERKVEPVEIGDISAVTLAPAGSDMGELKRNLEEVHPDISRLSLLTVTH